MKKSVILWSIILIIYLLTIYSISKPTKPQVTTLGDQNTLTSITGDENLRDLIRKRIRYVESRDSILDPVNKSIMDKIKPLVDTLTVSNIPAWLELLPGNRLGFTQLTPICDPDTAILFHFEQGRIGWYWFYMTFPDQNSSVMFYINRIELLPTSEREKYNLKLGESTIYSISAGVSVGGKWYRTGYYANSGVYNILDQSSFSFNTVDNMFMFSQAGSILNLQINTDMISTTGSASPVSLNLNIFSTKPMYFNGPNALVPDLFGDGTSYLSYTDLYGSGSVTVNSVDSLSLMDGIGWNDNQWGGCEYNSTFGKLLMNVIGKGSIGAVLPKYTWINLHVSKNLQYMVFCFPTGTVNVNDIIECYYNKYTPSNTVFLGKCNIQILNMMIYEGVNYPNVIQITVDGVTYVIDTSSYGPQITIDINNSAHYSGCGNLYKDGDMLNRIGTGFIENNRYFMNSNDYYKNIFTQAGYKGVSMTDLDNTANWYASQKDTSTYIFSLIILVILVIIFLVILVKLINSIRKST
jgi:hypothetical protein